jgi:hypothetical protein
LWIAAEPHTLILEIIFIQLYSFSCPFQHREVEKVKCETKYRLEISSTISIIGKTHKIPIATSQESQLINSVTRSATLIGVEWTMQLID